MHGPDRLLRGDIDDAGNDQVFEEQTKGDKNGKQ